MQPITTALRAAVRIGGSSGEPSPDVKVTSEFQSASSTICEFVDSEATIVRIVSVILVLSVARSPGGAFVLFVQILKAACRHAQANRETAPAGRD